MEEVTRHRIGTMFESTCPNYCGKDFLQWKIPRDKSLHLYICHNIAGYHVFLSEVSCINVHKIDINTLYMYTITDHVTHFNKKMQVLGAG